MVGSCALPAAEATLDPLPPSRSPFRFTGLSEVPEEGDEEVVYMEEVEPLVVERLLVQVLDEPCILLLPN